MGKRRYAKRKARQTYRHMDTVMENLLDLKDMFAEDHEDLAAMLQSIMELQLMTQQILEKWYVRCWGAAPSDWNADS